MTPTTITDELPATGFATPAEAAGYLRLSKAGIYRLMDSKEIPSANFGRARRIPVVALREYAAAQLNGGK